MIFKYAADDGQLKKDSAGTEAFSNGGLFFVVLLRSFVRLSLSLL